MPDVIDLRPLLVHAAAAEMLLLARGQLNRAFRAHGLIPPDPLPGSGSFPTNASELDDPAAKGIEYATAWHGDVFVIWAEAMPRKLVRPVLDILRQTHQALGRQQEDDANGARAAVLRAYEFLLSCLRHAKTGRMAPERRWTPAECARPARPTPVAWS